MIQQTRKPDRVVISCSSWNNDTRKEIVCSGIPVTVLYWKRTIVQAENRNIAAQELGTDIISFIDADDLMHPRRLEFILEAFERVQCDVIVHSYQDAKYGRILPFEEESELKLTDDVLVKKPTRPGCMFENGQQPFHHAHIGITKKAFSRFQYPIEEQYYRIEDAVYLATLLQNGVRIRYLDNKLSQYM
jgi:glycosyltransferase involved in cell wall biosynthesis